VDPIQVSTSSTRTHTHAQESTQAHTTVNVLDEVLKIAQIFWEIHPSILFPGSSCRSTVQMMSNNNNNNIPNTISFEPGKLPNLETLIWLRGTAADVTSTGGRRLRLAVMIQPNCPGCMMHALPVGNNLWRRSKGLTPQQVHPVDANNNSTSNTANSNTNQQMIDHLFSLLDVYCVSTAFEDFEYNNLHSSKKLLEGQHVGESLARLGPIVRPQCQPCMPMAFDIVVDKPNAPTALLDLALHSSKESARKRLGTIVPQSELDAHFAKVGHEILPAFIPIFFYSAGANGTPSWVLHLDDGTHLGTLFGWISESELINWMIAQAQRVGM
jgi:hypothetical protein